MKKLTFDENTTILSNGIKLVTIKKDTMLASINIGIKIGSIYEEDNQSGICHFIEHMLFKGTKNRDNEKLNKELESLGGEYNAYTDYTSTVYSVSCLGEEIEKATELLGDMIINSTFDKDELKREKGVILAEIRSSKDDLEELSFKRVYELGFNKSPLKHDIAGIERTVSSFNSDDLKDFYKKYYTPDNMILVMVSSFSHEQMKDMVMKNFQEWSGTCEPKKEVLKEKNIPLIKITHKSYIEQSTITYLYSLIDIEKEDELPLKILNHKLGDSANSILFRELREKKGLAYDIYSNIDLGKNVNIMNIFTSVGEDCIKESKEIIDSCIKGIKERKVKFDENTLSVIKKIHKTAVISTLEDCGDLCSYALNQSLEGENLYELVNSMEKLDKIVPEDIYRVCNKLLNNPTIHILKPTRKDDNE